MEEKLDALETAWQLVKSTLYDFELAGRINGFDDPTRYAEYLYDQAVKDLGDQYDDKILPEYLDNDVIQTIDRETASRDRWLLNSDLGRMQKWRIRNRPLDQWRSQERNHKVDVPVRLINVPAMTRLLAGGEPEGDGVEIESNGVDFGFIDLVIYSMLCSHVDRGIGGITMRSLIESMNPGVEWRHWDHDGFADQVKASVERLASIRVVINGECSELIDAQAVGDGIIVTGQSRLWQYAETRCGIIVLPGAWLKSGRCRIGWLDQIYVARRVRLANYQGSTMPSKISLESMENVLGHQIHPNIVMGYLGHLVRLGAITGPSIVKGTASWTPVTMP